MGDAEITEDDVRAARHGYYASLSYVDEKIGEVLAAFEACGLGEGSIVVFISDHGDSLGEHGLFFKMSFREHSARVPVRRHRNRTLAPRRVREPVSLLDLTPTLADFARPGLSRELATQVDGRSLPPLLEGADENVDSTIAGEYLAEGSRAHGHAPPWSLEVHPHAERSRPALRSRGRSTGARECGRRGRARGRRARVPRCGRRALGSGPVEQDVRESQRARLAVFRALQQGATYPWDFQPSRTASLQYTRNTMDVALRDQQARFPPAES